MRSRLNEYTFHNYIHDIDVSDHRYCIYLSDRKQKRIQQSDSVYMDIRYIHLGTLCVILPVHKTFIVAAK